MDTPQDKPDSAPDDTYRYPPRGNVAMTAARTVCAYSLLALQLLVYLFVFDLPGWIVDRFLCRNRGDAFYALQKLTGRWFFRLYPFGRQRRIGLKASAFPSPCVIVSNHQSMLDILMALTLPVNARWLVKDWVYRIPLMGETVRLSRHIRISSRGDDENDAPDAAAENEGPKGYDAARDWLSRGVSIFVFPEGGRSQDGKLRRFKNGAFLLAAQAKVPVVPVVLDGTGACVRKGSPAVHRPDLVLRVLPAVQPPASEDAAEVSKFKKDVQGRIAQALTEIRAGRKALRGQGRLWRHGLISRFAGGVIALLLATVLGAAVYVQGWCIAEPPAWNGDRSLAEKEIGRFGEARTLGENWRRERRGLIEVGVAGSRWERGYANAKLCPDLLEAQEEHLLATVDEFVPNPAAYWLLKQAIAINNRDLPKFVSEAEQIEVLGLVEGSVDHHPEEVPLYHRVLNYHAAHDISHMLIDNPLIANREPTGCTAFAVWGEGTQDGHLLMGRNFDWEAGEVFDQKKVVLYVWPDDGYAFVHVAWAGMAGAVTGMNEKGIAVSINAARTDDGGRLGRIGTPIAMVLKRVLEQAATLEEAEAIIREAEVFVSDGFLVASATEGRAIVVEKSPEHCAVREAKREGLLLQTNHYLTDEFADDEANREQTENATTLYRFRRLEELTERGFGEFTPTAVQKVLRDRQGIGDKQIGCGNRNALDAMICTHSVVFDVTAGEMWVSTGPHTVGGYVHVDVRRALAAGPAGTLRLADDQALDLPRDEEGMADWFDLKEWRKQRKTAEEALEAEDLKALRRAVWNLHNLNPDFFETEVFQGRLAWLEEGFEEAALHFERALELDPHYEETREEIRLWLQRARDEME